MKKHIIAAAAIAFMALNAQSDIMKVTLSDGTTVTYDINDVKEITFEEDDEETDGIAGSYNGTQSVTIGDMFTYTADIAVEVTENEDGTINVAYPEYSIAGTMMGDLTISPVTIPNIPFDEAKNAYYLNYSSLGLTQHFKAEQDGQVSMDADYPLGDLSEITVEQTADGIKITNPFKLGKMPLSLTSSFEGKK